MDFTSIDWGTLGVPQMGRWLKGMLSQDIKIRDASYNEFYDSGVVGVHKATPFIIPFLIEMLSSHNTPWVPDILQLLIVLASDANAYKESPRIGTTAKEILNEIKAGRGVIETYVTLNETNILASELISYI